jgi:hypothetical protein
MHDVINRMTPCGRFIVSDHPKEVKEWDSSLTKRIPRQRNFVRRCGKRSVRFVRMAYTRVGTKTKEISYEVIGLCSHCAPKFDGISSLVEKIKAKPNNLQHDSFRFKTYGRQFISVEDISEEDAVAALDPDLLLKQDIATRLLGMRCIKAFKNMQLESWEAAFQMFIEKATISDVHDE